MHYCHENWQYVLINVWFNLTYIVTLFSLINFQVEQNRYTSLNEQLAEATHGLRLCFVPYWLCDSKNICLREKGPLKLTNDFTVRYCRQMRGEDLEGLSVEELHQMERKLEAGLHRVLSTKVGWLLKEFYILQILVWVCV